MLSVEQFEEALGPLRQALEMRRKTYLRYYYGGLSVAVVLLSTAFFCPLATLHALQAPFRGHAPLTPSDIMAYRVFAALCVAGLVLGPVMGYRGERGFSVERAVMSRILSFFGDFISTPGGGIHAADVRRVPLFAPLLFAPEEGMAGEMHGVRVRLCETAFYRRENSRDALVFSGLFIICDLPSAQEPDPVRVHEGLMRLADAAKTLSPETLRWDEKLAYALSAIRTRLKQAATVHAGKEELPAEKEYRLRYALHPSFARAGKPQEAPFCEPYGFEYSRQRWAAAIAGHQRLFTLGSLFTPALKESRMHHLYTVMESIRGLTRHLSAISG